MIKMKFTENLTGVAISGDFNDLYDLVDAFYYITIPEDDKKYSRFIDISTRVLGFCYDIRHAYMGDRSVLLEENGMDRDKMMWHGIIAPENNVYYECNCLFPEMVFCLLAIDTLVEIKAGDISKNRLFEFNDRKVLWNKQLSTLRLLQSQFVECVEEVHEKQANFSRWLNIVSRAKSVNGILNCYIDLLNLSYLKLDKANRLKKINAFTKRVAEFYHDPEHRDLKMEIEELRYEYNDPHYSINFHYPEKIIW